MGLAEDQEMAKGLGMAKGQETAKGRVKAKAKDQGRCHPEGSQPLHFRIYRKHTFCSRHEQKLSIESDSPQDGTLSSLTMTAPSSLVHRQRHLLGSVPGQRIQHLSQARVQRTRAT